MPYPEELIAPMRKDLVQLGFKELRTADDVDAEMALILAEPDRLGQSGKDVFRHAGIARQDAVQPVLQRPDRQAFPCPAAHDQRAAGRLALKHPQILRDVPRDPVVLADGAILRAGDDQAEHGQTATGARIAGAGS